MCNGDICRIIQPCAVVFKGAGWTPRFGGKTGRSIKKIDKALQAAGVEDASGGWSKSDGKTISKKKNKRTKKLGQLKVD
jgi:hypothetical protein